MDCTPSAYRATWRLQAAREADDTAAALSSAPR